MIELGGGGGVGDICFLVRPESVVRFLSLIGEKGIGIETWKSCSIYQAVDSVHLEKL